MPNAPIHFARPGPTEPRPEPQGVQTKRGGVEALSAERLRLAEAAIKFNTIYMQLSDSDPDGAIARMQTCIEVAMDRVDETVRNCTSTAEEA